jgi:hypothetical protein
MRSLIVVAIAVTACGPKAPELEQTEFPGFSLELPHGMRPAAPRYRQGETNTSEAGVDVEVAWSPGRIPTADELPKFIRSFSGALPISGLDLGHGKATTLAGVPATEIEAKADDGYGSFVFVACGGRNVVVAISTPDAARTDELRRRIVGSFQCHPIAAEEASLAHGAPIGLDDPSLLKGWSRTPGMEVFGMTDGKTQVSFVDLPGGDDIPAETWGRIASDLFQHNGRAWHDDRTEARTFGGSTREFRLGTITGNGRTYAGALSLWACPSERNGWLAIAYAADPATLSSALDLLVKVRCTKPGDPPLPLADAPAKK